MDRFPWNIQRWKGSLVTSIGDWTSRGPVNDLTAMGEDEAFVAPATLEAGRRLILHKGPVTFSDHAVQAVVDRFKPSRSDGESLGLVLAWQVSGCDPDVGLLDLPAESDDPESEVLSQFVCQPIEDPELGEDNHLRVEVDRASLSIIERVSGAERTLFTMAIPSYVRRLALRAEHIDGAVTLWWNPDGYEEFPDAPLAYVHTMLDGDARPGVFTHRDGRFLSLRIDYRCETEATSPTLVSADRPIQDLRPVRLNLQVDESRPPIQTGYCITHEGDTVLPEAQHLESRIALRNVRLGARPGYLYRLDAHVRTVDGELVRAQRSTMSLEGQAEDLRLRDSEGKLVLFSWEEVPEGETRSDIKILEWPRELEPSYSLTTACASSDVDAVTSEFHDSLRRGVRRSYGGRRTWSIDLSLDGETSISFPEFFNEAKAQKSPILWSHPLTDEHVILRFANAELPVRSVENEASSSNFDLAEDPLFLDSIPGTPAGGGGSDSDSDGGDDGGGGDTCPIAEGAIVPLFMDPGSMRVLDRDPDRPAFRAANLQLPRVVRFSFVDGEIMNDPDHDHVGELPELIDALTNGEWSLEYAGRSSGVSRHWHHLRFSGTPAADWVIPPGGVAVTRDLWRATRTYTAGGNDYSIDLFFVSEFHPTDPDDEGALGAVFHLFAFGNQTSSYVDGTLHDVGTGTDVSFTRADPAVSGLVADAGAAFKFCHPQMLLCAALPTTFQSPIGFAWYSGNVPSEDQVPGDPDRDALANTKASCFAKGVGSPWSIPDPGPDLGDYFPASNLSYVGSAGVGTTAAQVTLCPTGLSPTRGACWYSLSKQDVRAGMTATFSFAIDNIGGLGGAGLAFVIQNEGPLALGGQGRGIGYGGDGSLAGITKSIAVEFDTHQDGGITDPVAGHVSVQTRGATANEPSHDYSLGSVGGFNFVDGLWHTAKIVVTTDSPPHLKLWVDASPTPTLDVEIDLDAAIGADPETAWVGFTAASGPGSQRVRVTDWKLRTGAVAVMGDPDDALDNSVFGHGTAPYGYAAMSLGGGLPRSAAPEWVTVEDVPGLTALRVRFPGWDTDRGGLIWRSSVTCAVCSPEQVPIDGCEGAPGAPTFGTLACMTFPPEAANPCCLPVVSRLDVPLVQLREDSIFTFDDEGNLIFTDDFIGFVYTRTIGMFIDEVSFADGASAENRYMEWRFSQRDPIYVKRNVTLDDFSSGTLAGWNVAGSASWSNPGSKAQVDSDPSTFGMIYHTTSPSEIVTDGELTATIAGSTTAVHAMAARASVGSNQAYLVVHDRAFQTLQIWKLLDDGFGGLSIEVLAGKSGVTSVGGDVFALRVVGSVITATVGTVQLVATDCEIADGQWGPAAVARSTGAAYDDVALLDLGGPVVTAVGRMDFTGWHLTVPDKIMPGYLDRDSCTGCCEGPFISCSATETTALWPGAIDVDQDGSVGGGLAMEVPIGTGAPWPNPRCDQIAPPYNCDCLFDDFIAAAATLYPGPFEGIPVMCPPIDLSECMKFNVWVGFICAGA